jgi:hypothetical protein
MKNGFAYLEEDCDAYEFKVAKERATGEKMDYVEVFQDPTPIRNYPSYFKRI